MQSIVRSERSWANRLIEEFMLSANECVASWLQNLDVPSLYRIHEKPEARRVVEFETVAAVWLLPWCGLIAGKTRDHEVGAARTQRGRGRAAVSSRASMRSPTISPSRPACISNWLLKMAANRKSASLPTSCSVPAPGALQRKERGPLRSGRALLHPLHVAHPPLSRPDRAPHCQGSSCLRRERHGCTRRSTRRARGRAAGARKGRRAERRTWISAASWLRWANPELAGIAYESSQAERRAEDAERELMEWKKVKFMQDRIGDDFDGMILSITKYGCFVELDNLFIEGLVPIMSLAGRPLHLPREHPANHGRALRTALFHGRPGAGGP